MQQPPSPAPEAVPRRLVLLGSAVVVAHLLALGFLTLAAPSGPWMNGFDGGMTPPPRFAQVVERVTTPAYLKCLKMTHNYHFPSNRPGAPGVFFEARLKDAAGRTVKTLRFPDERANPWVRHRQALLARGLADDRPLPPPQGESVAAPDRQVRTELIWDVAEPGRLRLREVPEHLVPRNRPVFRPSEWSLLLARSYARYLCRTHGAQAAELVRHTREPVSPGVLAGNEPPAGAPDDLVAHFGEFQR